MTDDTVQFEDMSDDDFIAAANVEPVIVEEVDVQDEDAEVVEDELDTDSDEDKVDDQDDSSDDDQLSDDDDDSEDSDAEDRDEVDEDTETLDGEQDTEDTSDFDFKAGYEELLKPFKANGKEMSVDNVEDARRLMQMGAGFQKRMGQLKPHLKIIKSLKDNDLLDVDKINNLIDIGKKDPKAIAKLIKEAGIDPLDIDTEGGEDYEPTDHSVTDSEFDLDQAIEAIKDNDSYDRSIKVMGEQWDDGSRDIIAKNPEIVGIIDAHIQNGIFDKVQEYVDRERTLGGLSGISDVEAYRIGVQTLIKSKVIVDDSQPTKDDKARDKGNSLKDEAKIKQEAKRKKRRKAAAPSKGRPKVKKSTPDYDNMSDEEFMAAVS